MKKFIIFSSLIFALNFSVDAKAGCNLFRMSSGDQATHDLKSGTMRLCDVTPLPPTEPVEPEGPSEDDKQAWVEFLNANCTPAGFTDLHGIMDKISVTNCYQKGITDFPNPAPSYFSGNFYFSRNPLTSLYGLDYLETAKDIDLSYVDTLTDLMGLNRLKSVGTLTGSHSKGMLSLSGLDSLESADGLIFYGTTNLEDVSSLSNLKTVGKLQIQSTKVADINSLSGLTEVGQLYLSSNKITSLKPLGGVVIKDHVDVSGNQITSLEGLEGLTTLSSQGGYAFSFNAGYNPNLTSLKGLENFTSGEYVQFNYLGALTDVTGLSNLGSAVRVDFAGFASKVTEKMSNDSAFCTGWRNKSIKGVSGGVYYSKLCTETTPDDDSDEEEWVIFINEKCRITTPFELLSDIENSTAGIYCNSMGITEFPSSPAPKKFGKIFLSSNNIPNMQGWDYVERIDTLEINSSKLQSLEGLESLTYAERIKMDVNNVTTLLPLSNVTYLNYLDAYRNKLENFIGLDKLTYIDYLRADFNELTSLNGLEGLTSAGELVLNSNGNLTDISALSNLTTVKNLGLGGTGITNAQGLNNLQSAEILYLNGGQLTSLDGLDSLTTVGSLMAFNAINLKDISGLLSLTSANKINLSHSNLSQLKGLENITSIVELDLSYNPLVSLEAIKNLDSATKLNLNGAITPGVIQPLLKTTPFCQSIADGSIATVIMNSGVTVDNICVEDPADLGQWLWVSADYIARDSRENVPAVSPSGACFLDNTYVYTPTYNQDAVSVTSASDPLYSCLSNVPYPSELGADGEASKYATNSAFDLSFDLTNSLGVCHPANVYKCVNMDDMRDVWSVTNTLPALSFESYSQGAQDAYRDSHNLGEITSSFIEILDGKYCLVAGDRYLRKVGQNYLTYSCGGVSPVGELTPVSDEVCDVENGVAVGEPSEPEHAGVWSPSVPEQLTYKMTQYRTAEQEMDVDCYSGVLNTETGVLEKGTFLRNERQTVEIQVSRVFDVLRLISQHAVPEVCGPRIHQSDSDQVCAGEVYVETGACYVSEWKHYFRFLDGKYQTRVSGLGSDPSERLDGGISMMVEGTGTGANCLSSSNGDIPFYDRSTLTECNGINREIDQVNYELIWNGQVIQSGYGGASGLVTVGEYLYFNISDAVTYYEDVAGESVRYDDYKTCRKPYNSVFKQYEHSSVISDYTDEEIQAMYDALNGN